MPVRRAQELAQGIACSGVITFPSLPPLHGREEQWIVMERTLTKEGKKNRSSSSSLVWQVQSAAGHGAMSVPSPEVLPSGWE